LSDEELDWIAKYRAALDSRSGEGSSSGKIKAAIRRLWRSLSLGISPKTADSSVQPQKAGSVPAKKLSKSEGSAMAKSDTKAS